MVEAINNGGRMPTRTSERLQRQLGFDQDGINALQDALSNIILVARPAIKNQENLKRKARRMVE